MVITCRIIGMSTTNEQDMTRNKLVNIVSEFFSILLMYNLQGKGPQRNTTQNRRSALDATLVLSCRVASSCGFLSGGKGKEKLNGEGGLDLYAEAYE
jgi:hypothetical protein